jgi:putative ABC transport system ATP-binding protein
VSDPSEPVTAMARQRPDRQPALELGEVTRTFRQGDQLVRALDRVSLVLEPGEFAALAGPSGSGKTTLLNVAGGLDRPDAGRVRVGGRDLGELSADGLARLRLERVAYIFQGFNLVPVLSAEENAEFILLLRGVPRTERRDRVRALLAKVGLAGLERRRPAELSGGQQQRVAIVRAIVAEPELVLADEPTANLDTATASSLLDVMETLHHELRTSFLFSTHDPRIMERAHRLIRLRDGRIESDEPLVPGTQASR